MKKAWTIAAGAVFAIGVGFFILKNKAVQSVIPVSPEKGPVKIEEGVTSPDIEIVAQNLDIPWEIAFLPSGEMLVTERPGKLLKIGQDKTVIEVSGVRHVGEGGLLGLALHPDFANNQLIYLYLTSGDGGQIVNRVERYRLEGSSLSDRVVILEGIEGASNHDGGRLKFGPDGYLYVTTGDAQEPNSAQDTNSLNGKILRITSEGGIPSDNPYGTAVYSYGHRNVQGITWDSGGRLWATEHGRSGVQSGLDELNLIESGKNYGWPEIQGDETQSGMVRPIIHSGASETWAPSGAEFLDGSIFFAGLRGETLYQAKLSEGSVSILVKHFQNQYGRLRTVKLGTDGFIYILTNNRDGRGQVNPGDDKIIRFKTSLFE
jgi:glucose/arabinose dehydrogenase